MPTSEPDSRLLDREIRRWTAAGAAIAVALFWMVATLGRPWRLFVDQGIVASRFFDIQAERLLHGHLTVPRGSLGIEEFATPHGSHMYFGIFPALVRMPFFLFDRSMEGRLTLFSCLVAVAVTSVAVARLARRVQRLRSDSFGDEPASPRWYLLIAASPSLMTPMIYLAARSMVYHEAIAWGVAGALWAVVAVMQWWDLRRARDVAFAALATCVALNSRPSVGMLPVVMVGLLVALLVARRSWRAAMSGVAIAGAAVVVYCAVNLARFGQLFGAPHRYQVAFQYRPVQQAAAALTDGSLFSARFVPTTFMTYFDLWPDDVRLERLFPFAAFGQPGPSIGDVPMQLGPTGSLPAAAPVLVVLAAIGVVWVTRKADVAWRAAVLGGVASAVLTLGFWAVWHRYLVDFVPLLFLLAIPGGWTTLLVVRGWSARRRTALVATAGAVTVLALSMQVGLAVWSGTLLMSPDRDDMATTLRMRYAIDDAFFRGMPPDLSVVTLEQTQFLLIMPAPGRVVIAGDCDAMYTGEFGWTPFEMRSGGAFRSVVSALPAEMDELSEGPRVVSSGGSWSLVADPGDAATPPALRVMVDGQQVAEGPLAIPDSGVVLDVVADGLLHVLTVTQDGATVLSQPVEGLNGQQVSPGWDVFEGDAPPTCADLLAGYQQDQLRLLARGR